jgi:hypothetical protein
MSIIFADYDVEPEREVSILLKHGSNDEKSDLAYSEASGWVSHIGLESGCSPSLLSYFELAISKHYGSQFKSGVTPN